MHNARNSCAVRRWPVSIYKGGTKVNNYIIPTYCTYCTKVSAYAFFNHQIDRSVLIYCACFLSAFDLVELTWLISDSEPCKHTLTGGSIMYFRQTGITDLSFCTFFVLIVFGYANNDWLSVVKNGKKQPCIINLRSISVTIANNFQVPFLQHPLFGKV